MQTQQMEVSGLLPLKKSKKQFTLRNDKTPSSKFLKTRKPLIGVSGFLCVTIKTVNLWALGTYFTYVILNFTGGANGEEDISNFVCFVVFLVISWFVFYKPSYVYEKEG
jgi:hypothetical protein